jgi:hypothetical protein
VSQGEDLRGNAPARLTRIRPATPRRSADICDESTTRREGGQPPGQPWHTLVSRSLTTEYRPVRPLVEARAGAMITLGNELLTMSNIFQFVMT